MSEAGARHNEFIAQFDNMPFHQYLGLTLVEAKPGYGKVALRRTESTPTGIGGSVHGGVLAAVVDIVMLVAVMSDLGEEKQPAGTADLGITYLRQAQGEVIYATAEVIKSGRQLASVEIDITDDAGTLCAKGRTLYAFRAA
jgi:uncharacterized protein (TIGR00369 family)